MKLATLLEWNRRDALAIQQAIIDHPAIDDAKLVQFDVDEIEFEVTWVKAKDIKWKVSIFDMLDGKKCTVSVFGPRGINTRSQGPSSPFEIAAIIVGLVRNNPDGVLGP